MTIPMQFLGSIPGSVALTEPAYAVDQGRVTQQALASSGDGAPGKAVDASLQIHGALQGSTGRTRADQALEASQKTLEDIINSVQGIVWEADARSFQFTFVSHKAEKILGYPLEQWIADPAFWYQHLHSADRNWVIDLCTRETNALRPHELEYRMIAADGSEVWVRDIVSVISEHGTALKRRGIIVDITESKRADETLREIQLGLQLAMQASNIGPWNWNLITNQVHFSREWKGQLGYADDEIAGQFFEFVNRLHPEDNDRIMSTVQAYIADPSLGYDVEFRMQHKDGSYRWIHTRAMMLFDDSGKPVRMMGCHLDITERKQAEMKLESVHKQLLDASRRAGMAEIATNVLHNVGNVLTSLNVSASLVSSTMRASKAKGLSQAVQLMNQHAAELGDFLSHDAKGQRLPGYLNKLAQALDAEQAGVIEELAQLSRSVDHIKDIVAAQLSYADSSSILEPVQLCDLAEDALRMNDGALTKQQVRIVREFAPVPLLLLDRMRVLQILVNLISNAKHAMAAVADGVITLRLEVVAENCVRVCVQDDGEGILPENLTRIFAHGFTTRKGGHGFGLHSCALAAREMGGTLTAHSAGSGQGAVFTLDLPLTLAQDAL